MPAASSILLATAISVRSISIGAFTPLPLFVGRSLCQVSTSFHRSSSLCLFRSDDAEDSDNAEHGDSPDAFSGIFSKDLYLGLEAFSLTDQKESKVRQRRYEIEEQTRDRFVYGRELSDLRERMTALSSRIKKARQAGDTLEVEHLREELRKASLRDAEYVYGQTLEFMEIAFMENRKDEAEKYRREAAEVKKCLPHFNIEGLWVGKYGAHGYEMINVTYVDDSLIAYKVTGDKNVPKGEISFKADLRPSFHSGAATALNAIQLTDSASKQWGTKELIRFPGKGQVAAEGYKNAKWMEGQLIMVGEEYFSFAWIPIGHQIFFGRPSPELTLRMLRESEEKKIPVPTVNDDVHTMRDFATRCLDATDASHADDEDFGDHFQ